MKNTATFILLFLCIFFWSKISAQDISCDNFCVTNIRLDTQPGIMIVRIFFNADEDIFINYPHVSLVTNEEGDTLATGSLNFFGQFGNTEYEYHLNTSLNSIPENFSALLEFKYDANTCLLNYPCVDDPTNEWFPIGAEWYYNQINFLPPSNSYVHVEVIDTAFIQNKIVKVISGGCFCSQNPSYLYQDGDRIFAFHSSPDTFGLLYDFSLNTGDTLEVYIHGGENSLFLIDSITTFEAGPLELRVQHITHLEGEYFFGNKIYERIGSNGCLFPVSGVCDPATSGLRCYDDDITGLLNFTFPEIPCDFISAIDDPIDAGIKVFPNPAVDLLHIESDVQLNSIALIHIPSGITLTHQIISQNTAYLDFQIVPPGAYLLQILTHHGSIISRKVIITGRQD